MKQILETFNVSGEKKKQGGNDRLTTHKHQRQRRHNKVTYYLHLSGFVADYTAEMLFSNVSRRAVRRSSPRRVRTKFHQKEFWCVSLRLFSISWWYWNCQALILYFKVSLTFTLTHSVLSHIDSFAFVWVHDLERNPKLKMSGCNWGHNLFRLAFPVQRWWQHVTQSCGDSKESPLCKWALLKTGNVTLHWDKYTCLNQTAVSQHVGYVDGWF